MKSPTAAARSRAACGLSLFLPSALLLLPIILCLHFTLPQLYFFSSPGSLSLDSLNSHVREFLADRGTGLLHTWSDEELFQRALNISSISPPGRQQHRHFLVRGSGSGDSNSNRSETPPAKVAFLFLTTGELPFAELWERFFRGHQQLHNIYVHLDPFSFETAATRNIFWGRYIPNRRTQRASPSLVSAMKRLLASALLDDPHNTFFAFISDSCIPLHGFRRLHRRLVKGSRGRSFMEVITRSELLWSRYNARGEEKMLPEVPFDKFAVGSQWFVVNRRHARMLVGETSMWEKFKLPCLQEFSTTSCYTEEHYFSTVMNAVDPQGTHTYTLTSVEWPENTDGHPTTYHAGDVSKELLQRLQKEKGGRFLFARKFAPDCLPRMLELADVILKH